MSSAKENIRSIRDQVQPSPSISTWQVVSTLVFFVATIYGLSVVSSVWLIGFCFLPLLALIGIRLFVLQHDCGHLSLYQRKASNDIAGQVLAWFTTVPYELWRSEHRWHHLNQGNLSSRGVDMMNSPPTVDELKNEPEKADDWNAKSLIDGSLFCGSLEPPGGAEIGERIFYVSTGLLRRCEECREAQARYLGDTHRSDCGAYIPILDAGLAEICIRVGARLSPRRWLR